MIIVGLTIVDFILYFTVDNFWVLAAWFLLMLLPKGCICAWNHHHQHTKTFRETVWNRLLEVSYALHTGVTTHLWLLHHVLGHHHNYLDQTLDESRWKRADGTTMGELEYTMNVALTSYYRGWQVGRRYPHLYRTHLIYTLLVIALVAALTWFRPMQSLMLFILPMISGILITAWVTYDHHAGLDETENHFAASFNNLNPVFNLMTGNLGYHTAHHYKQGVHWSELPALHETIKAEIPQELYKKSFWEVFNTPVFHRLFRLNT
ncbi:MAG: fatty acid desaturase [Pseudomonadales bacterium]|nr:fatty acid desaturase [Pseudomonadales bacterium]